MKVVLDTSVLVSSFYKPPHEPSFSKDVYDYVVEREEAFISSYILDEFRLTCIQKLKFSMAVTKRFESIIKQKTKIIPLEKIPPINWEKIKLRDPNDRPIVELAAAVKAGIILTWDKDLLILKLVEKINIMSPKDYWNKKL